MISQNTIDAIFQATRVEDVIDDFVKLTKRGVNFKGLCPFHDEKTPSFTVSPTRNIYKCFGCGRGGNAVTFLMEHEGLSYPESLRFLARKYNIEIEETAVSAEYEAEKLERDSLFLINEFAGRFYQKQLKETDIGKSVGLSYFKERGLLLKTIDKFELGYSPANGDQLTRSAVAQGYNIELLRQLGLTTEKDRDFFFNRVMFPIHNLSGKIVAFAGRQLSDQKKSAKYINSKESDIYHKSKVLYGLHLAKQAIRKEDHCILVEGYTDVLSLHQSGIENIVASSGTALTVDQIRLIKRYTNHVKVLYDGDTAGVKAALRGIDLILEQDLNIEVVLLPEKEDPDSYLSKIGATAFKQYLDEKATDFILFKTNLVLEEAGNDPVKKASLIKDIIGSLARIQDPIKRSVYLRQCATLLEVEEQILVSETNKSMSQRHRNQRIDGLRSSRYDRDHEPPPPHRPDSYKEDDQSKSASTYTDEYQERDIVRILILHGNKLMQEEPEPVSVGEYIISHIQETIPTFDNPLYGEIVTVYGQQIVQGNKIDADFFTHHPKQAISQLAISICSTPYSYSENWEKMWGIHLETQPDPEANEVQDSIQALFRFLLRKYQKMSEENNEKIKKLKDDVDGENLIKQLQVQSILIEKRNEIANKLNTVIF